VRITHRRTAAIVALLCLGFALTAPSAAAAPGGHGNGVGSGGTNGNGHHSNTPSAAATPEVDSLMLFGSGALGMLGYALMRRRAGRGRDNLD
jgi:hypothetical protein